MRPRRLAAGLATLLLLLSPGGPMAQTGVLSAPQPVARPAEPEPATRPAEAETTPAPDPLSLTFTVLSRGQGVPPAAFAALMEARAWILEAQRARKVRALRDEVIGLEGETRICLRLASAAAAAEAVSALSGIAANADLARVSPGETCPEGGALPR